MSNPKQRCTSSYYRTLYAKYGVEDSFLQSRQQRRATGAFLEQLETGQAHQQGLSKRHHRRLKQVFKRSPFYSAIAGAVSTSAMLALLQTTPVLASEYPTSEQQTVVSAHKEFQAVINNEDSDLGDIPPYAGVQQTQSTPNVSLHLVNNKPPSSSYKPREANTLIIDEDSDITPDRNLTSLTVIDTAIQDWQVLQEQIQKGDVLLLEGDNPLDAIIEKLEEMGSVDALNVISHGSSGSLHFTNHTISEESLIEEQDKWSKLGQYISKEGDILLFGCNVAHGENGTQFIDTLSNLTGADVAASVDVTGHRTLHGDWDLEAVTGYVVEHTVLRDENVWQGVLPTYKFSTTSTTINTGTYTLTGSLYNGVKAFQIKPTYRMKASSAGFIYFNKDTTNAYTFYLKPNGSSLGSFDISDMQMSNGCNSLGNGSFTTFDIVGYLKSGGPVSTSASGVMNTGQSKSLVNDLGADFTGFNDVEKLKVTEAFSGGQICAYFENMTLSDLQEPPPNDDGTVTAAGGVSEPVDLVTTALVGSPLNIFDFAINDGGGDATTVDVSQIRVNLGGTSSGNFSKMRFNLTGCATQSGIAPSGSTVTFPSTGISVSNGSSVTCTVQAYWNDNTNITDNQTLTLSVDGDADLTVDGSKTTMSSTNTPVTTGNMSTEVVATKLTIATQPAGSDSHEVLTTQPVVHARDAVDNLDLDYTTLVIASEDDLGSLVGTKTVLPIAGVATFTDLKFNALADQSNFQIDFASSGLTGVSSNTITSDVVAEQLIFTTEPAPTSILSGDATAFTTVPVVKAVNAGYVIDQEFTSGITLTEILGPGNATMTGNNDTDGSGNTVTVNASLGASTFDGLTITYTNDASSLETFKLQASSGTLITADSTTITSESLSIASSTYDAGTGTFVVAGVAFESKVGADNDVTANKFTIRGNEGNTYTLTDTPNVEIDSSTQFTLVLSATDKLAVNGLLNADGLLSDDVTTYNLAAADDWMAQVTADDTSDLSGNSINVSNVALPTITSAIYDWSTGVLTVTGSRFVGTPGATNDVDISKLTLTGQGGTTRVLTTSNVEASSETQFSVTLNAADKTAVNLLLNKNGPSAVDLTTYNIAASDNWMVSGMPSSNSADLSENGVTVFNVDSIPPAISNISIPDSAMKVGDVVTATITVTSDPDDYSAGIGGISGTVGGFTLGSLAKTNNTTYTASFSVTNGGTDVAAGANIPVSFTLDDSVGNTSTSFTTPISQGSDAIDSNNPVISNVTVPNSAMKIGDAVTVTITAGEAGLSLNSGSVNGIAITGFTDNTGGNYSATYTVASGHTDRAAGDSIPVSVVLDDPAGNSSATYTTAISQATDPIDANNPVATDDNISISGATGTGGAFKVGDTITATWDDTVTGDNNSDTISSVTADFSNFGGGASVPASNSSDTWKATYTISEDGGGSIDGTNLNISLTVTDDGNNSVTTADSSNATLDNDSPVVGDSNISISGATGTGGAFKVGDTVTATWDNSVSGDNNADTIAGVTFNFSAFGGGSSVSASKSSDIWTATYTLVGGAVDVTNSNVSASATDNAGNTTTTADSTNATVDNQAPAVTDNNISISGGTGTGGAFKVGDTVTATWDNTAGGDNNSDIVGVTVDFSQFGGGSNVAASNSSDTWTSTFTITEDGGGTIDATNCNVAVTATDNAANSTTMADSTDATVDNKSPAITDPNISISGATGTDGAFKVGDTVTATWDNTTGGDNNADTIAGVTFNFSAFGGGSSVSASKSSDIWTATYTLVSGTVDVINSNVSATVTDNGGNTTTTGDSTNATVDNQPPTVTDPNISISGGTGTGGAYQLGDTVTVTWNNTGGGDNNGDITGVTVDFSQFGGGTEVVASKSSDTWTATYTITGGTIDGTNLNASVTATDNAGNTTTTADTTNVTVDNQPPTVTDPNISISGGTGTGGAFIVGDTVTATWDNTAGGDNNTDINTVTADFSAFGGGASVSATNSSDTWTAAYTIVEGAGGGIEAANLNISVTGVDNAGNGTTTADSSNASVDNIVPAAPSTPDMTDATDTGTSNSDDVTADATPIFEGTAEDNITVEVTSSADGLLGTAIADGSGNWSYTPSSDLTDNDHTITAVTIDSSGNRSTDSTGLTVTIDSIMPSVPSAPDMMAITDNGVSSSDDKTSDTTPIFEGTADPNSIVTLTSSVDGQIGLIATTTSSWSIDSTTLSYGTHTITATATDSAGNTSSPSTALSVLINHDPVFTGTPYIDGIRKVDEILALGDTGTSDADSETVILTYQWLRAGNPIIGAASDTYQLVRDDINTTVSCEITALDTSGGLATAVTDGIFVNGFFPWEVLLPIITSPEVTQKP